MYLMGNQKSCKRLREMITKDKVTLNTLSGTLTGPITQFPPSPFLALHSVFPFNIYKEESVKSNSSNLAFTDFSYIYSSCFGSSNLVCS